MSLLEGMLVVPVSLGIRLTSGPAWKITIDQYWVVRGRRAKFSIGIFCPEPLMLMTILDPEYELQHGKRKKKRSEEENYPRMCSVLLRTCRSG